MSVWSYLQNLHLILGYITVCIPPSKAIQHVVVAGADLPFLCVHSPDAQYGSDPIQGYFLRKWPRRLRMELLITSHITDDLVLLLNTCLQRKGNRVQIWQCQITVGLPGLHLRRRELMITGTSQLLYGVGEFCW